MGWEPIKCYICSKDAEQWNYDTPDFRVRPPIWSIEPCECGFYLLTEFVLKFRMDKQKKQLITKEKIPLTKKQKRLLINWIKENQDSKGKEPVKIDLETYDNLIQK
jgi:hypothetical protein